MYSTTNLFTVVSIRIINIYIYTHNMVSHNVKSNGLVLYYAFCYGDKLSGFSEMNKTSFNARGTIMMYST